MCCLESNGFVNIFSANKFSILCSVDLLYYVCLIVAGRVFLGPGLNDSIAGSNRDRNMNLCVCVGGCLFSSL